MKPAPRPLACVMGDIDLLHALAAAGIPCAVVAKPGAPVRFSRFARTVVPWSDTWDAPERQLDALLRFAATQPTPPVLFYEEDRELLFVSRYRDRLAAAFRFVIPDRTLVEDLVDKDRFQALAARLELPVPPARIVNPAIEPCDARGLRFPLVVKPLTRRTDRWDPLAHGAKALDVDGPEALRACWPRLAGAGGAFLAQEAVPGGEERIESYHAYVDGDGRVVADFTGRKLRTWPLRYGHSTALVITTAPDVAERGREILRRLGLCGVAKLDFKRGPDGTLWLLEINARFTLWHHPGALAGVNVPAIVYADLTGGERPIHRPARAGVRWSKVWDDVRAARAGRVSWASWLRWTIGAEAKRALAWDDPLPLLGAAVWRLAQRARGRAASEQPAEVLP